MTKPLHFVYEMASLFRKPLVLSVVVLVLCAIEGILRPSLIGSLIDAIRMPQNTEKIYRVASYLLACHVFLYICKRLYEWCLMQYESQMKNIILQKVTHIILQKPYSFFQQQLSGRILSHLNEVASAIPTLLETLLRGFFLNFMSVLLSLGIIWYISPYLGVGFSLWVVFMVASSLIAFYKLRFIAYKKSSLKNQLTGHLLDLLDNIFSIKIFNRIDYENETIKKKQKILLLTEIKHKRFHFIFYSLQGLGFLVYQGLSLFFLNYLYQLNHVSSGEFIMVLILNMRILDYLWGFLDHLRALGESWSYIVNSTSLLKDKEDKKPVPLTSFPEVIHGTIEFQNLYFSHLPSSCLFDNLSLKIPKGQKVGIVGYAGSGKTTFINLLLGLFKPQAGKILLDGHSLEEYSPSALAQAITIIPQNPSFFHQSFLKNITYARLDASKTGVEDAAKKAYLHNFIRRLPRQYQSIIGDKSTTLSGGQKQKLSMARAFLKNAPILVLDEATSQMDAVSEKQVQKSLQEIMRDKTVLIISHRLKTLQKVDRILVFNKGKIVQDGGPEELLSQPGIYKELWENQLF